jgi:hypothetical protein
LVGSQVNPQFGFALLPADWVFSQKVVVFKIQEFAGFAIIQSRVHEIWARFFSSTSIELLSYTPSDCYETFPFPNAWNDSKLLEDVGRSYYAHREKTLIKNQQGITRTYNRFHSQFENSIDLAQLRNEHAALDTAVLRAYGWDDLANIAAPDFLTEATEPDHRYQGRLFWPAAFREEVLARLLDLNRARAEEERHLGLIPRGGSVQDEEDAEGLL